MKNLLFILLAAMAVLTSCIKEEQSDFPYNQQATSQMVAQSNERHNRQPDEVGYGFSGEGSLVSKRIQETYEGVDYDFLSLQYTGDRLGKTEQFYAFDIGLDFGEVKFPDLIANVSITYLGNQLIVRDLDSDFVMNFFVRVTEESENVTPKLEPVFVSSLRVVHEEEGFEKRLVGCSCFCVKLPNNVPSRSRHCECESHRCDSKCEVSCSGASVVAVCHENCPIE